MTPVESRRILQHPDWHDASILPSPAVRDWLLHAGSLTRKLQQHCACLDERSPTKAGRAMTTGCAKSGSAATVSPGYTHKPASRARPSATPPPHCKTAATGPSACGSTHNNQPASTCAGATTAQATATRAKPSSPSTATRWISANTSCLAFPIPQTKPLRWARY